LAAVKLSGPEIVVAVTAFFRLILSPRGANYDARLPARGGERVRHERNTVSKRRSGAGGSVERLGRAIKVAAQHVDGRGDLADGHAFVGAVGEAGVAGSVIDCGDAERSEPRDIGPAELRAHLSPGGLH